MRRTLFVVSMYFSAISLQGQNARDAQQAEDLVTSVAGTIYKFAWPTATFKSVKFAGIAKDPNGLVIQAVFSGTGAFGDTPRVKLGLVVNQKGIQDIKIMDHDELFAGPFRTSMTIGALTVELAKELAAPGAPASPAAPDPSHQRYPTPVPKYAKASCIENDTADPVVFQYRWGDGDWQSYTIPAYKNVAFWEGLNSANDPAADLFVRYDSDYAPGYTEQRYRLESLVTPNPPPCDRAKDYFFTTDGRKLYMTTH